MDSADTAIHATLQRDVGRLEGKVDSIDARVSGIDAKLDQLMAHIEREKGAKNATLRWGAVAGGVVGAFFSAVVAWWTR